MTDQDYSARDRVRVWNSETSRITRMPAAELAPGMMVVRVQAENGAEVDVWMDQQGLSDIIHKLPVAHGPLSEAQRARLQFIKTALDEVSTDSLEAWEESMRHEQDVDQEIGVWERIAQTYVRLTSRKRWHMGQRAELFQILLACASTPREHVRRVLDVYWFDGVEVDHIFASFFQDFARPEPMSAIGSLGPTTT